MDAQKQDLAASAKLTGNAAYSVRQTRVAANSTCPVSGKPIDKSNAWSVFSWFDALDIDAEHDAPPELVEACRELNGRFGLTDCDQQQVGICEPMYFVNGTCPMSGQTISRRDIDAAIGLGRGERVHGVSLSWLRDASPTLSRYLASRFNTLVPEPLAPTPAPTAEEVAATVKRGQQWLQILSIAQAMTGRAKVDEIELGRAAAMVSSLAALFGISL